MNFLKLRIPFAAWEFGLLKLAMFCVGIVVGSAFPEFWKPLWAPLLVVFLVASLWLSRTALKGLAHELAASRH
jgi:hypothetical protein